MLVLYSCVLAVTFGDKTYHGIGWQLSNALDEREVWMLVKIFDNFFALPRLIVVNDNDINAIVLLIQFDAKRV